MFARSAKFSFLFFLCLAPAAFGRSHNFFTGTPLGIGFKTGLEKRPGTDFVALPQTTSSMSAVYSVEPFADFGNFVLKPYFSLHSHPLIKGSGTDPVGSKAFSENSNSSTIGYGLLLELVPFISESLTSRTYVLLGGGHVTTKLKTERSYAGGATYTEKAKGTGDEYIFGAGYEFFFVQNYSLALEAGYRRFTIEKFGYTGGVDVTGAKQTDGTTVKSATTGAVKKFHEDSPYFALSLNLNF